jgi:hypothetical protein
MYGVVAILRISLVDYTKPSPTQMDYKGTSDQEILINMIICNG